MYASPQVIGPNNLRTRCELVKDGAICLHDLRAEARYRCLWACGSAKLLSASVTPHCCLPSARWEMYKFRMSAYVTSKHAVIGLMRAAAIEGAADDIRVNTVNPSPIDTRMMSSIEEQSGLASGDRSNRPMARHTPLQRYGEPEEVARLMMFLSSDDSSFCTGGVYMVDGGVSAGRASSERALWTRRRRWRRGRQRAARGRPRCAKWTH